VREKEKENLWVEFFFPLLSDFFFFFSRVSLARKK
jgi:hypothetical protein